MNVGTTSPTTLLCVLLLFIGGFFVILFWLFRTVILGRKKRDEATAEPLPATPQTTSSPQPHPRPAPGNPGTPLPADRQEVMRILRDPVTRALSIEIEGREYRRLAEVRDEQTGRTILQVITDLLSFTGGLRAPTPTPVIAPSREAATSASLSSSTPAARPATVRPGATRLSSPKSHAKAPLPDEPVLPEEKPPQPSVADFFRRGFRRPQPEPVTPRSFIDEIEDILQRRLLETPLPGSQEMHVRTGPDGGLQIVFQGRLYSSPDELPDPVARETIKAAVREWERS